MARAMNLGDLMIGIQIRTAELERGMREVRRQLNSNNRNIQQSGVEYDKLAVVASLAFWKIASSIKTALEDFKEYRNAMVGLKSIVQGTGGDFQQAQGFINDYTKDGLIPAANAATALKNLLARGFSVEESTQMLSRLKDAAAFGRQASLSLGQAVQSASEGIKNENSVLVDNAGVTKNVSKMWEDYAKTIGKTTNDLSLAEKRQAEFNGIMEETRFQVGDAAKYSQEFAGIQAKTSAQMLKISQLLGQSVAPILGAILEMVSPILDGLAEFVEKNQGLVGAVTITVATLVGLVAVFATVKTAAVMLTPAIAALNASFLALLTNPIFLALLPVAAVFGVIAVNTYKAKKEQEQYNRELEEHNKLVKEGISKAQAGAEQEKVKALKELATAYEEANGKLNEHKKTMADLTEQINKSAPNSTLQQEWVNVKVAAEEYMAEIDRLKKSMKEYGATEETITRIIREKEEAIMEANRVTVEEYNNQAKTLAQRRTTIIETQALIESYRKAERGTSEWYNSQKKLSDMFPQFSSNSGIAIDAIDKVVKAQDAAVKAEWRMLQQKIYISKIELGNIIKLREAKLKSYEDEIKMQENMYNYGPFVKSTPPKFSEEWIKEVAPIEQEYYKAKESIKEMREELENMGAFLDMDIDKIQGIKVPDLSFTASKSTSETNKAYADAVRLYQHKKRLGELSADEEIATLQRIRSQYVKTAEERMAIDEMLFDVKQEMIRANQEVTEDSLQAEEAALKKRTEHSYRWIEEQKKIGQINAQEEIDAYSRMLRYHQDYLAKTLADKRRTEEEKERIYQEELNFVRDIENKIFSVRQEYTQRLIDDMAKRTQQSFNWIDEKKFYGELTGKEEIAAFNRMIQYHKDYLNQILRDEKISQDEKDRIREEELRTIKDLEQKVYSVKKQFLEKAVNDYVDEKRKQYDLEEQMAEDRLNKQLRELDKEYEEKERIIRESERETRLQELKAQEEIYANAATREGKDKLKSIQEEIARLNKEAQQEEIQREKEARKEAIEEELQDTRKKYDALRDELDTSKAEMLAGITAYAKDIETNFTDATATMQDGITKMMDSFYAGQEDFMSRSLGKIKSFVSEYQKEMEKLKSFEFMQSLDPIMGIAKNQAINAATGNPLLVFNDYGDKNLNGIEDVEAYGKEVSNVLLKSTVNRTVGGWNR